MSEVSKDARLEAVTLALFGAEYYPGPVPKGALDNWAAYELQARRFLAMYDAAHGYPVPERGGLLGVVGERREASDGPSDGEVVAVRDALMGSSGWILSPGADRSEWRLTTERMASAAIRALDEHRAKKRGA